MALSVVQQPIEKQGMFTTFSTIKGWRFIRPVAINSEREGLEGTLSCLTLEMMKILFTVSQYIKNPIRTIRASLSPYY